MTAAALALGLSASTASAIPGLATPTLTPHVEGRQLYLEHTPTGRVYWYDHDAATAYCNFYPRHLRFSKGEWQGRPFILEPWQRDHFVAPLFGWKRVVENLDRALWPRRYRKARLWVPRKNGKTELLAGTGNLLLVGDREPGAEIYAHALNEDQARIVFQVSQQMAQMSPTLSARVETFKDSSYCAELYAKLVPLTGKSTGKHGFNPHAALGDEMHEWTSLDLHTFIVQGMGARRQPLDIGISTAGKRGTPGRRLYEESVMVRDGIIDDPETLVLIYEAAADDDWMDPAVWAKANPNLGISPKHEYMQAAAKDARQLPRLENDFKRYHLNIWTEQDVRWLPMHHWDACNPRPDQRDRWQSLWETLRGRRCYGGLDLAAIHDVTALCWFFPPTPAGDPAVALWRYWVPADTVEDRVRRDGAPYDQFIRAGALETTPGNVVDYRAIRDAVEDGMGRFDVQALAVDKWNSTQMIIEMIEDGIPAVWYAQSGQNLSPPSKQIERMVLGHMFDHGGNPMTRWMAANAAVHEDHRGNIIPSKQRSSEKIDGIAALVMAVGISMQQGDPNMIPSLEGITL